MTKVLLLGLAAATAAAACALGAGAARAGSIPVATGCPAGWTVFPTDTAPYRVPAQLDDPANGGNNDRLVCALALPDAVRDAWCAQGKPGPCLLESLGVPLYDFTEDEITTPRG